MSKNIQTRKLEEIEILKVASVETPGLREDDRQDTLTDDGQDGRYITCTMHRPPSKKSFCSIQFAGIDDTQTQTHHTDTQRVYILSNLQARHPHRGHSRRCWPHQASDGGQSTR